MNPKTLLSISAVLLAFAAFPVEAQDDLAIRNSGSAYGGSLITGPAANPLSYLNGPAYGRLAVTTPYLVPDFRPASLLDEKLPGWISFGVEDRFRYEGYHNGGFKRANNDSYTLNRFRLQMNLRFSTWFKVVSQLQDARAYMQKPPYGPPNEVRMDLKLAYAEFSDPNNSWFNLRVGRQLISYNNTIISNSEWKNPGRSYDAAVVNLHHDRYSLGIFAASVVVPLIDGISHHQEGNNIYGLYGRIDRLLPKSTLEPFVLWRVQPSVAIETTDKIKTGKQDEKAYGVRFKGLALGTLDYSYEAVLERGADGPNHLSAWSQTFGAGYRMNSLFWHPRAFAQYDYASGDKNPNDGTHGTFDTMYPSGHDRFGISDQFGWQNIVATRAGLTVEPHARWTVTAQYLNFGLANASDSLYNSSGGSIVRDKTGNSGTHIGEEFDVYTSFDLNRHVNLGVGVGHLMPGSFLANMTKAPTYNTPYFAINFKDAGKKLGE